MYKRKKVVILYSSGLDSLVNLHILKDLWNLEPILLFVDYGQKALQLEYEMTEKVSKRYGLELIYKKVDLEVESKLVTSSSDINIETTDSREAPVEIVPYRNIYFAHLGIVTARKRDADYVSFGFNISEAGAYPDNTARFLDTLNNLYMSSTYFPYEKIIKFISSTLNFTKTEIVMIGKYLDIDFSLSTSCYYPENDIACGTCTSCRYRIDAFKRAKIKDTVKYKNNVDFEEDEHEFNRKIKTLLDIIEREKESVLNSLF